MSAAAIATRATGGLARRALLLGVLSALLIAAQVSLTRLFSAIFWYHFAFLILSTSMLGFGLGGLAIRLLRAPLERWDEDTVLAGAVAASGGLLAVCLFLITHNHFSPLLVHSQAGELVKLVGASVALMPAFVVMGATVLFALQRGAERVDALYAANLAGSGLGCVLAMVALDAFGGLVAYLGIAAALPLLAAWYAWPVSRRTAAGSVALSAALLLSIAAGESLFPLSRPAGKPVACAAPDALVFSGWTSLSKVDICREPELHAFGYGLWGLSRRETPPLPERLAVVIDYWAYTTILEHRDDPGYYDFYGHLPLYMAYRWTESPSVLVIGSGGGMDVRGALRNGAREVDAVEINPSIYRAMTEDLVDYSGGIYRDPRVNAVLGEGRRFLESSRRRYDLIQLSGVDTHSATQAGAFALSENFLYTKEAFATYLEHLEDDGVLTLTRWFVPSDDGLPRFSIRLFTLAVESLAEAGFERPWENILFFRSGRFSVLLVKKQPISREEIAVVEEEARARDYQFLYRPDRRVQDAPVFYAYVAAPNRAAWIDRYPFDVAPPTDDRPFFFEHRKLGTITRPERFLAMEGLDGQTILAILMAEMLAISAVLLVASYRLREGRDRPLGWLYFAAIGLGFMLVEVSLAQRLVLFLGHPAYALSVVMFSLLVFSGLGSLVSSRLESRLASRTALFVVAALMIAWAVAGNPLLRVMIAWPTPARMVVAVLLIAPAALLMGTAFPSAVRRLTAGGPAELGVYWAWNGVASVVASVLAVVVAMTAGFSAVMILAAVCYAVAGSALPSLGRSDGSAANATP